MLSLICAWTKTRDAGDLRRHRAQYDVTVVIYGLFDVTSQWVQLWLKDVLQTALQDKYDLENINRDVAMKASFQGL